jgi:hypothetical protein
MARQGRRSRSILPVRTSFSARAEHHKLIVSLSGWLKRGHVRFPRSAALENENPLGLPCRKTCSGTRQINALASAHGPHTSKHKPISRSGPVRPAPQHSDSESPGIRDSPVKPSREAFRAPRDATPPPQTLAPLPARRPPPPFRVPHPPLLCVWRLWRARARFASGRRAGPPILFGGGCGQHCVEAKARLLGRRRGMAEDGHSGRGRAVEGRARRKRLCAGRWAGRIGGPRAWVPSLSSQGRPVSRSCFVVGAPGCLDVNLRHRPCLMRERG